MRMAYVVTLKYWPKVDICHNGLGAGVQWRVFWVDIEINGVDRRVFAYNITQGNGYKYWVDCI
jgi:hypothetical protein